MTKPDNKGFLRRIVEFTGRQERYEPPEFSDTQLMDGPFEFEVGLLGRGFLPSFPATKAIVVSPSGEPIPSDGGYVEFPAGRYAVYYIDQHQRYRLLPVVSEETADGASFSIQIGINYQVIHPDRLFSTVGPVEALEDACQAALRRIISRHMHEELISSPDNRQILDDAQLAQEITHEIRQSHACRAFSVFDVRVLTREVNSEVQQILKKRLLQGNQTQAEVENLHNQELLAGLNGVLARIKASTEGQAKLVWAKYETLKELKLGDVKRMLTDIEITKRMPEYEYKIKTQEIESLEEALKALVPALVQPGLVSSNEGIKVVKMLTEVLKSESRSRAEQNKALDEDKPLTEPAKETGKKKSAQKEEEADDEDAFIHLMIPKKKKPGAE